MVEHREKLANWIGLLDSAMGLMKEMTTVTNSGRVVDFATYYVVELDTMEDKKKNLGG